MAHTLLSTSPAASPSSRITLVMATSRTCACSTQATGRPPGPARSGTPVAVVQAVIGRRRTRRSPRRGARRQRTGPRRQLPQHPQPHPARPIRPSRARWLDPQLARQQVPGTSGSSGWHGPGGIPAGPSPLRRRAAIAQNARNLCPSVTNCLGPFGSRTPHDPALAPTDLMHRIADPVDSPDPRFAAATLLAIPLEVTRRCATHGGDELGIPIDGYGPDVDAAEPARQAAYDADVDDLFDCWVRNVFDAPMTAGAARMAPASARRPRLADRPPGGSSPARSTTSAISLDGCRPCDRRAAGRAVGDQPRVRNGARVGLPHRHRVLEVGAVVRHYHRRDGLEDSD